ncbi:MAG: hypothetical protein ACRD2D_14370, partial [Terriglobales bacterium]
MQYRPLSLLVLVLALPLCAQSRFTIQDVVAIKYPSAPAWSADGRTITFTWDEGGVYRRYTVDALQPGIPNLAPATTTERERRQNWSPNHKRRAYFEGGGTVEHNRPFPEVGNKLIFRITE